MTTRSTTEATDPEIRSAAEAWLAAFERALANRDGAEAARLFDVDAWWRDLLVFSWDIRSISGPARIRAFIDGFSAPEPRNFRLLPDPAPVFVEIGERRVAEVHFSFETAVVTGTGIVKLTRPETSGAPWTAWIVFTAAETLIGHEESVGRRRPFGAPRGEGGHGGPNWSARRAAAVSYQDREPDVLVVGAGHCGLGLAARLGRLGVDTLVVERNPAVGDNWRKRYDSLVLHDSVWGNHLPYLDFPPSWPVFTPKDLLADWLAAYATLMAINVWTDTHVVETDYDDASGRWTIRLRREGTERTVRPAHVVFATGTSGSEPFRPDIPGSEAFGGTVVHSSEFSNGIGWEGRRAVVVGASTSGHDIAHELVERGAEVTMIQRGATYVSDLSRHDPRLTPANTASRYWAEDGPPTEIADRIWVSMPYLATLPSLRAAVARGLEMDEKLLSGLRAAGFATSSGVDGTGGWGLYIERGGGYYPNVGASNLIADGRIRVKSGVGVERFTSDGIVLSDGTALDADLVVLATGYRLMPETVRSVVGDAEADRVGPIWGIDDEGELRGMWRPSGHPGLWFTGGNLALSRYYSRILALRLKAELEGLTP